MQRLAHQPCVLCGAGKTPAGLCGSCLAELPALPSAACSVCAAPLASGDTCGPCLARPPRFDGVTAVYVYDFPVDALVRAYKYGGDLRLARLLGQALAQRICAEAEVIVPMPLAPDRLRRRGYNQALLIAREIARLRGLPVWAHACRRVIDTPPQALLPWRERASNVRGAFVCDADLHGRRVAVVDDVLTTGATLNELARNLKRAGAVAVYGWVAARAVQRAYRRSIVDWE